MRRTWIVVGVVAVALILVVAAAGLSNAPSSTPNATERATTTPVPATTTAPTAGAVEPLGILLAVLRVAPEDRTGYDRGLFVHWIDADGDGCDTRREVLIVEALVAPTVGPGCSLIGGRWLSAYDGLTFTDIADLQIDHVVALAEAWDSGASAWTPARREDYANDLGEPWPLIAVSSTSNQSKSDKDPADWLPPARADECPFLSAWIATKARWNLAVDPREHDALVHDISDCPGAEMPYDPAPAGGQTGGESTPEPTSGATLQPGGACDPAYPTVCIPAPPPDLDCGQIAYRNFRVLPPDPHHFDGDKDGIGCET